MGLLGNYFITKIDKLTDSVADLLTKDPEGLTQAEIMTIENSLDDYVKKLTDAKMKLKKEEADVVNIQKDYDLTMSAAKKIQINMEAALDDIEKGKYSIALEKLITKLENLKPQIEQEKEEAKIAADDVKMIDEVVKSLADKMRNIKKQMEDSKNRLERAKIEKQRADDSVEREMMLAGIRDEKSKITTATNLMDKKIADINAKAAASREKANALKKPIDETDEIIANALREETPKTSLSDRLKNLE